MSILKQVCEQDGQTRNHPRQDSLTSTRSGETWGDVVKGLVILAVNMYKEAASTEVETTAKAQVQEKVKRKGQEEFTS